MRITLFALILLLGVSGSSIKAQNLLIQDDKIAEAFKIGFLAMAPKIMCTDTVESVFITLTNMTRPIEVMVRILDGPSPEDALVVTPVRVVGTPCACIEFQIPHIEEGRRVVTLQLLARRTDLQCDDFEVTVHKKVFIDSCAGQTFIETDKPVYSAGQTVKFRVLTLRADLRPDRIQVCNIWIEDPRRTEMIEWKETPSKNGLIQKEFTLSKEPLLGEWMIKVIQRTRRFYIRFRVERYERPRFEIILEKPPFITVDAPLMKLKICARSPLGQAVRGSMKVRISVENRDKITSKKPRPVLTFNDEDTGLNACHASYLDIEDLELCSQKYPLSSARLKLAVTYTAADTGVTIQETDTETIIAKEPFRISFDASPVFKKGLPYHGKVVVRYPDNTPAIGQYVTVTALGGEFGIYEETLKSDEEGIINFVLPEIMYEIDTLSIQARSTYQSGRSCRHPESFPIFPPVASITAKPQYSPTGSFIQILPITERVKINKLQTITIYFVTQKPEYRGINFHVMFMSRGKILRSTAVYILPEDYDGFTHPGAYLPIPVSNHEPHTEKELAEPHIGPIDTPVNLVEPGKIKMTHRKFKITAAMSPVTSVIVYYVRKDNEVVSEMIDFNVEEVFENKVKMKFNREEVAPNSLTKLRIRASPGSLCAYGVVDKTIYMMGEQNRITRKRVFDSLAKLQLSSEGGYADENDKCGDVYPFPILNTKGNKKGSYNPGVPAGKIEIPGFAPEQLDASITFMNMGIVYLTNLAVETRPCPAFRRGDKFQKEIIGLNKQKDMTPAVDAFVDVTGKLLNIKSFFPKTWLWEIKETSEDTGETDVNVLVPDRITTWMGRGFCTNPKNGAGVSNLFSLKVFLPFFLMLELPPPVIRGEKVPVTVTVFDNLQECMVIKLSLKKSDDFTATEVNPEKTVCACRGRPGTAVFYIVPFVTGQVPIEVYGLSLEDNIENSVCGKDPVDMIKIGVTNSAKKSLTVEARGIYVEEVFSSYFCPSDYSDGTYEERILLRELPASFVPGSSSATISVTGDLIAPSLIHLDKLLHLPLISGEQNLLKFAPNVYILRYLRSTKQLTLKVKAQAVANMITGYQRQQTFRRKDGSYVVFRNEQEGSSWLTANVVRVFAYASQFMSVDIDDLQTSVDWLKSIQDVDTGCFHPTGTMIHRALRGTVREEVALTAYVMSAMLEAGVRRKEHTIKKGMECLDLALNGMGDPYTAALMAYTFALADQSCLTKAINILNELAIVEPGTIHWETQREDVPIDDPYLHRQAAAQDIELTSYVLLSYSIYRESTYAILSGSKIAHWIVNQLNDIGGFASTQDTMVALQALSEYAKISRKVRGKTDVDVNIHFTCEKEPRTIDVTEDNRLTLQSISVPLIPDFITVDATGDACAMTQVIVKYNSIPEERRDAKFVINYQIQPIGTRCNRHKMKICATYAGEDRASNLAVIRIKLVSGYSAEAASVEDLKKRGLKDGLKTVEVDGKTIDIFVDKFTLKQKCFKITVKREFEVEDTKKGVITVYDYYEPSRTVSAFFKYGCDHDADNEENEPKPGVCPMINLKEGGECAQTVEMCQDDSSCTGSHKCCSNGCGHMCMKPTGLENPVDEHKFGTCPLVEPSRRRPICNDKCASDDECDDVKKCCQGPSGCKVCYMPSELNPCPKCLTQLPAVAAQVFCKYDYVVSGTLLDDGYIQIRRNLKTKKKIKIPTVKADIKRKCECPILKTRSLVMLMLSNQDLDMDAKTLSFHGSSAVLKLTTQLSADLAKLPGMCGANDKK